MNIQNMLLITDMDGTLLTTDKRVSAKNREAITRWVECGGQFTIATGRSIASCENHITHLPVTIPAVLFNGSVIFDYRYRKSIYINTLPSAYYDVVSYVYQKYPMIGIELMCEDYIWVLRHNEIVDAHLRADHLKNQDCLIENLPSNVIKVLFGVPYEQAEAFYTRIQKQISPGIYALLTDAFYCELMAEGTNKAEGIEILKTYLPEKSYDTICVGDYLNDLEMIQRADFGVAVKNALPQVKKAADYITASNDEDAIARVIDEILANKIKIK